MLPTDDLENTKAYKKESKRQDPCVWRAPCRQPYPGSCAGPGGVGGRLEPQAHMVFSPQPAEQFNGQGASFSMGSVGYSQPGLSRVRAAGSWAGGCLGGCEERGLPGTRKCGRPARHPQQPWLFPGALRNALQPPTPPSPLLCLDCLLNPTAGPLPPWLPQLPTAGEPHTPRDPWQQHPLQSGCQVSLPA